MSKLQENPAKVVPVRIIIIAIVITFLIVLLSLVVDFDLLWTLVFFWLAAIANFIAFKLIVIGSTRLLEKKAAGEAATMMPNLFLRYSMYLGIIIGAWFAGGVFALAFSFVGIQLASIAIKLDSMIG